MSKIRIKPLIDFYDCAQEGCSGGEEEGGQVYIDDELVWELIPRASCWDNNYYPDGHEAGLLQIALEKLGHTVEVEYE